MTTGSSEAGSPASGDLRTEISILVLGVAIAAVGLRWWGPGGGRELAVAGILLGLLVAAALLARGLPDFERLRRVFRPVEMPGFLGDVVVGIVGILLIGILESAIWSDLGAVGTGRSGITSVPASLSTILLVLGLTVAGVVEEVVFRGWGVLHAGDAWPRLGAWTILLSSVLWSAAYSFHAATMLTTFLIGLWLGYLAWKRGSIVAPVTIRLLTGLLVVTLTF